MTGINKKKEEFELDWDTDTFETKGFAGVERDKRGELAVLLPAGENTISRLRGFVSLRKSRTKEGEASSTTKEISAENESLFTGDIRDTEGIIAIKDALLQHETKTEEKSGAASSGTAFDPTQVIMPSKSQEVKPSISDFDLDYSSSDQNKKESRRKSKFKEEPVEKQEAVRKSPPVRKAPPSSPPPKRPISSPKKDIPFEEPEFPDDLKSPIVIKREKKTPEIKSEEGKTEEKSSQFPSLKAHSYLEEGSVLDKVAPPGSTPSASRKTKKKMKLPKRVGGERSSPLLILLMILMFLILGAILAVQYVPEAREYYDQILAKLFDKTNKEIKKPSIEKQPEDKMKVNIGPEQVKLKKNTDMKSVNEYVDQMKKHYSEGKSTNTGANK